jgi:hypothetical protein
MITLTLTEDEGRTLINILECAISEVHSEIVHCETMEYKDMLKARKHILVNILEALKTGVGSAQ